MKLTNEELFALVKLFTGPEPVDIAIASAVHDAHVVERISTDSGAFSTVRFSFPFPPTNGPLQRDWSFSHRDLEYGGSLMASLVYPDVVELEFVAHIGFWPKAFDPSAFRESV